MPRKNSRINPDFLIKGQKVRKIRRWLEISLDEAIEALEMNSKNTYNNYENGFSNFTDEHLEKLAKLFDIPDNLLKNDQVIITVKDMLNKDQNIIIEDNKSNRGLIELLKNINSLSKDSLEIISKVSEVLINSALENKTEVKLNRKISNG